MDSINFKNFGKAYQEKIMQALITDHSWAKQFIEVVRPEYFEQEHIRFLFDIYSKYWERYKIFPSFQLTVTLAKESLMDLENPEELRDNDLYRTVVSYIKRIRDNPDIGDLPYVKEHSLEFCKKQALLVALEDAQELADSRKYDEIIEVVKKAMMAGSESDVGHDFFEDYESRFVEEVRNCVPTGKERLDERKIFNGGLAGGEMGLIIAPTGVGKSHWLVDMGCAALRKRKNVLHYTFELRERIVGIRYDSNLCNISSTDVPSEKEFIEKKYEDMKGNLGRLIIKEYPTNSASVMTLRNHIEKLSITKNFIPDIIIIDYADIMRSTKNFDSSATRHELKLIYEQLRGLSMELDIPIWTASQSGRESANKDVVGLEDIAEAWGKAMVCDVIVTLARKQEKKASGQGNLFIAKNRLGMDGVIIPCLVDTAKSSIELLDDDFDLETYRDNQEKSTARKLRDRFNELQENNIKLESVSA